MADPADDLRRALEGRYAILSEIGRGGMATVYLGSLALIRLLSIPEVAIPFVVLPMAIGGAIGTATGILRGLARKYRGQLEAIADRLAARAAEAAGAPDGDPAPLATPPA